MNAIGETPEQDAAIEASSIIVLLVEDEVLIRMDLADVLRDAGCTVYEAGTADAAIELLQSPMRIDLVVTDVRMPGKVNGIGLAEYVRQNRPGIKVVVMSGDYHPRQEDQHLFERFFLKPFSPQMLIKAMEALMKGTDPGADRSPNYAKGPQPK